METLETVKQVFDFVWSLLLAAGTLVGLLWGAFKLLNPAKKEGGKEEEAKKIDPAVQLAVMEEQLKSIKISVEKLLEKADDGADHEPRLRSLEAEFGRFRDEHHLTLNRVNTSLLQVVMTFTRDSSIPPPQDQPRRQINPLRGPTGEPR